MMRLRILLLLFSLCSWAVAQQNRIYDEHIRSLQVSINDDPLVPAIMAKGKGMHVNIGFDELSHDYHRYHYHIAHCQADWTESEEIFESDYLAGLNDQPIEDYENSFNTTQLYTHYSLTLPNENTQLLLSGNYRVTIYDDEDEDTPVLTAEFCIVEPKMNVGVQVSSNTDIDFNSHHQQVSYSVGYGSIKVIDPQRELHTVVMQNRRQDNRVIDLKPNVITATGIQFTYQKALIFPAGNEFHKLELLDVHRPGMGIDNIRWHEPYYHATVYADRRADNYDDTEDQNGAWLMRNTAQEGDDETTSEYLLFHFALESETPISAGDVYLCGQWTNGTWDPECLMEYNRDTHLYEATLYLKQGYYNYQYRVCTDENVPGSTRATDGDFYETENEYIVLVYHRPQGGRYDQLVGYSKVNSK